MNTLTDEQVVLAAISAVERRDRDALDELYHPDVEFSWPPGLPYSGRHRGAAVADMSLQYATTWIPLQPTDEERRMDPVVVAAADGAVVARYQVRGVDFHGNRFETPTLARYTVRDGRLASAEMYHFDLTGLQRFLTGAAVP